MTEQSPCLFALHATAKLGAAVAAALDRPLAAHEEREFEDGEHKIRPLETVRGANVFVLQSLHGEAEQSANDKLCKLLFFIAALKDGGAAHSFERAYFMLAILEFPLLVRCQRAIKCSGDRRAELGGRVQRKEAQRLLVGSRHDQIDSLGPGRFPELLRPRASWPVRCIVLLLRETVRMLPAAAISTRSPCIPITLMTAARIFVSSAPCW